jgi:hypothetical protein
MDYFQLCFNIWQGVDSDAGVGAEAITDAVVSDTLIFVRSAKPSNGTLVGSLVLNNIRLNNVYTAVGLAGGGIVLPGSPGSNLTIKSWVQGNVYAGTNPKGVFTQDSISAPAMPYSLLNEAGQIFGKTHPQYADYHVSQFVSVRDHGATGDGKTDDTDAIKAILHKVRKVVFNSIGS